jgi:serine/arginine repetitive matrix protein 2
MYNGIGLSSVRGSGTSGYVQANAFNRHKKGHHRPSRDVEDDARHGNRKQGPNADVLAHNRKREMELKVFEYRVELEDEGVAEDEIDRRVDAFRARLVQEEEERAQSRAGVAKGGGTHEAAARKQHDMQKLQDAFGVGGYEEGAAFTKEYHERKKREREEERLERHRMREEEEDRRREEREARELARARAQDADSEEEKQARERALDAELDAYRREERDLDVSNRYTSGRGGAIDLDDEESDEREDEEDGEDGEEEAARKRARHDTESEEEEEQDDQEGQEIEQAQEEHVSAQRDEEKDVTEDVAAKEPIAAPAQPASASPRPSGKAALEDVILELFAEKDVLRKKEIVAAAEEAGVQFSDGEYSKLMRKLATSQPGGKWKKNE